MRSGNLKNKVILEQKSVLTDTLGAENTTWSTFKECYASIEPLRGQELFVSQQIYNKVMCRIRLRYTDGIKTDMRVNHNGHIFEIESVVDIREKKQELHLMCSEVV